MKRFLVALNIVIWSIVAVEAQAEVQVPNYPHSGKSMFLVQKESDESGTILAMFRVSGWKSGQDSFTVVEADCRSGQMRDLAFGEGSIKNIKKYPDQTRNWYALVGNATSKNRVGYEGSFAYNRYRALCG